MGLTAHIGTEAQVTELEETCRSSECDYHALIRTHLEAILKIPGASSLQREFWQWQHDAATPVEVVSFRSDPELEELVEGFLQFFEPSMKECYYTAAHVSLCVKGAQYVEGMTASIIPIDHAWNCWNGIYFDLTAELVLPKVCEGHPGMHGYTEYFQLDAKEVFRMCEATGQTGEWTPFVYRERVLGEDLPNVLGREVRNV